MHRSKDSLLWELSLLMTARPATLGLLLPNPAFHSPSPAAEDQHRPAVGPRRNRATCDDDPDVDRTGAILKEERFGATMNQS